MSLDEDKDVQYQTVSYVWGSASASEVSFVTVDGSRIPITPNLKAFLHRIRDPKKTLTLWVDTICINQQDDKEKTQQVNMMHRIFRQCVRCLVWIGEIPLLPGETEEEASNAALGAFNAIRMWSDLEDEIELPPMLATDEGQKSAGRALQKFMDAPWWSRIWTVQEVVAPRKTRVLWGPHTISWALMQAAAQVVISKYNDQWGLDWFKFFPSSHCDYFTAPVIGLGIAAEWKDEDPPPIEMLWRFRSRDASDPRDKVFALFGLDRDDWSFLPTITSCTYYELDVVELFKKVTIDMLIDAADDGADRGLRCLIGLRGEKKKTQGLPSWALDWTIAEESLSQFWVHNYFLLEFTADQGLPMLDADALVCPDDDSVIRLNGLYFDSVAVCSEIIRHNQNMDDLTAMLLSLIPEYIRYCESLDENGSGEDIKSIDTWQAEFKTLMEMSFIGDEPHDPYWSKNLHHKDW